MGRDIRLPIDLMMERPPDDEVSPTSTDFAKDIRYRMRLAHAHARDNLKQSSEMMKIRTDARASTELFDRGQQAWFYNPKRKRRLSPKLASHWEGPYTVIDRLSDVTYRIQRTGGGPMKVVHYNRLWKHKGRPHFSWNSTPPDSCTLDFESEVNDATEPADGHHVQ